MNFFFQITNCNFKLTLIQADDSAVNTTHVYPDPSTVYGKGKISLRLGDDFKYDYESEKEVIYKV